MLGRPDGFFWYGKRGVDFFSTSELLHENMKARIRLIRVQPNIYMISDNPTLVLELLNIRLTLVILLSKMITTRKE